MAVIYDTEKKETEMANNFGTEKIDMNIKKTGTEILRNFKKH